MNKSARTEFFAKEYAEVFEGDASWNSIKSPTGSIYRVEQRFHVHQAAAVL